MNTSTIETRKTPGKRLGVFLLGLAVAAAGSLAFAGGQAGAVEKTITFDKGLVNLGFAFKGEQILPAPQTLPGSDPAVVLPNLFELAATASGPDGSGTAPNNPTSFKPAGCATPVTFGLYAALLLDGDGNPTNPATPGNLLLSPAGSPFGNLLVQPFANSGAAEPAGGRSLAAGALVPAGETVRIPDTEIDLVGPYPATNIKWIPFSVGNVLPTPIPAAPGLTTVPNPANPCTTANPANGKAVVDLAEDGSFTGTAANFQMPIMIVPNPLDGSPVPITLRAPEGITGQIGADGAVRIDGPMQVRVLVGLASNPLGQYCALNLPGREPGGFGQGTPLPGGGFALTTSYMLPTNVGFAGTPFSSAEGLEGSGALTGTWNQTEDSVSVGGADCSTVNSVSKGLGGIWLSSGVADPAPISGNCSEFNRVGTFPNCLTKAAFGKVTVKGPGKAKRNKATTYTVRVPNSGEAEATGVKVAVKGKGVKASANGGKIAGKKAKSVKVKVKAKRAGKVKMTFTVTGSGIAKKTVSKTIRVR